MSIKKAYLQMHTAIFLWGFTGILGKLISLNEGLLVWYRLMISGVIMWFAARSQNHIGKLSRKEILKIGGVGVIVMIHWVTFYGAIKISSVSVTLICLSSIALFTSIFEPIIAKTKFDYLEIFFAGLAMAGIYTIYHSDTSMLTGILVAVFSSAASALFSVLNKQLKAKYNSYTISIVELAGAFLSLSLLLPFYLPMFSHEFSFPGSEDMIYLFILSFFCTVIPWILSLNALTHVTAFTQNLALNLEPVYGIILAIVVVGEYALLNTGFYIGAFIILMTVLLHTFYRYRKSNV
jgi:drug/metabolite transporter (DMT)-like permease